jgi:hypothetical protein
VLLLSDVLLSVQDKNPRWPIVTPKLAIMEQRIAELGVVIEKLVIIYPWKCEGHWRLTPNESVNSFAG